MAEGNAVLRHSCLKDSAHLDVFGFHREEEIDAHGENGIFVEVLE